MNLKQNNLQKLGFGSESFSETTYALHVESLNRSLSYAYAEGIFGAAKSVGGEVVKGVKLGVKGAVNGGQMAVEGIKRLWALIKKIMVGFANMVKQMWLDTTNNTSKMASLVKQLDEANNKLKNLSAEVIEQKSNNGEAYKMITVETMRAAGWSLDLPKDMEQAVNQTYKNLSNNTANEENSNRTMGNSVSIVAYFCKLVTLRADGQSPENILSGVKDIPSLYNALNNMFKEAYRVYSNNPDFGAFTNWKNVKHLTGAALSNSTDKLIYQYFNVDDYGKYVAQAFSPAGAFISTNNRETFNSTQNRIADIKKKVTPSKYDVPATNAINEMQWATKYLGILFHFLLGLNIPLVLKNKSKKLDVILNTVKHLESITNKDAEMYKQQNKDAGVTNNGGYTPSTPDRNVEQPVQPITNSESFNGLFDLDDVLNELRSFGEDEDTGTFTNDANQAVDAMNNLTNDQKYKTFMNSKVRSNANNINTMDKTKTVYTDTVAIPEQDITPEGISKGLKYLHSYLVAAGNLTFQEGRFFNVLTKMMCENTYELLDTINKTVLSTASLPTRQNKSDNVVVNPNAVNNNTNTNNNTQ